MGTWNLMSHFFLPVALGLAKEKARKGRSNKTVLKPRLSEQD